MNHMHFIRNIFNFIGLQMSNHMPTDILWKFLIFIYDFLNFVLTKITSPCIISFL